ncbi:MAG: lysine 2,3-aminomutase, partial [Gammaproteobacteria bacterium]|nr:lysine 2,3-aminomutase [Gammaproteobacteria bacterium]
MNYAAIARRPELVPSTKFKVYTEKHLDQISQLDSLPSQLRHEIRVVARILPFRVNQYVLDTLIDWDDAETDPMFLLTFPQKDMLEPAAFNRMAKLVKSGADTRTIHALATQIRQDLNPHPAGQMELNVPMLDDQPLSGMQ